MCFGYVFTIPASGNICHTSYYCTPIQTIQLPSISTGTTLNLSISQAPFTVLCLLAIFPYHQVDPAICLLLYPMYVAVLFNLGAPISFRFLCISCRTHLIWVSTYECILLCRDTILCMANQQSTLPMLTLAIHYTAVCFKQAHPLSCPRHLSLFQQSHNIDFTVTLVRFNLHSYVYVVAFSISSLMITCIICVNAYTRLCNYYTYTLSLLALCLCTHVYATGGSHAYGKVNHWNGHTVVVSHAIPCY